MRQGSAALICLEEQIAAPGGAATLGALLLAYGLYRGLSDTFTDVLRYLG